MKILAGLSATALSAMLIAASPGDDLFEQAALALAKGVRAEVRGGRAALHQAGAVLAATGAQPIDGQPDLAQRWQGRSAPPPMRNRTLGPAYRSISLAGGASAQFDQVFYAGQHARAALVPTSGSGFTLTVRDDQQAAVCTASPRNSRCDWVPTYTTRFRIEIRNAAKGLGEVFLIVR